MKNFIRAIISPLYWFIMNRVKNHSVESSTVGFKAKIGRRAIIRKGAEVGPQVEIGDYSYISGPRSYVEAAIIGKYCSIARQTIIGVSGHNYKIVTTHPVIIDPYYGCVDTLVQETQRSAPVIGHDVWIGLGSFIMRGVTISNGAVVAANSVVTKDVAPYSIVGGNPARHISYRFPQHIVEALQKIQWWDWSEDKIRQHRDDFYDIENFVKKHYS